MKVLELFAGSRSVGRVAEARGHQVFSMDIHPFKGIDLAQDILDTTFADIPFIPDLIWASPPCTTFSVASIGHHWTPERQPKTDAAKTGMKVLEKTFVIIDHFLAINPNLKYFVENPRGMMRTVLDRPRATVWYCRYGDVRAKPTDIFSNHIADVFNTDGWTPRTPCFNGNGDCHHQPAPRGSKTGTQGIKRAYDRSRIPSELVSEILDSAGPRYAESTFLSPQELEIQMNNNEPTTIREAYAVRKFDPSGGEIALTAFVCFCFLVMCAMAAGVRK